MKKFLLSIILLSIVVAGFSQGQARRMLGQDTTSHANGRVYIDTLKSFVLLHPLIHYNAGLYSDTLGMDTVGYYISTFALNGTSDSVILTLLSGRRLASATPTPALTANYVGYGSGSGRLTGTSNFQTNVGSNVNSFIVSSGISGASYGLNLGSTESPYILEVANNGATQNSLRLASYGTPTPVFEYYKALGTAAAPTAVTSGTILGQLGFEGQYDGTVGHLTLNTAVISIVAAENFSSTNQGTTMDFLTTTLANTVVAGRHRSLFIGDAGQIWMTRNSSLTPIRTANLYIDGVTSNPFTGSVYISHTASAPGNIFIGDATASEGYIYHYGASQGGNLIGSMVLAGGFLFQSRANAYVSGTRIGLFPTAGTLGGVDITATGVYIGTQAGMGTISTMKGYLELGAGTTAVPQLVLDASTVVTTPVNGAVEGTSTHISYTAGGTRFQLDQQAVATSPSITPTNTTNIASSNANKVIVTQVGTAVHIRIGGAITPTTGATPSTITIPLPITTTLTSQVSVGNIIFVDGTSGLAIHALGGIVSGSTAAFTFTPSSNSLGAYSIELDYTTN